MLAALLPFLALFSSASAQVTATFPNGVTNPAQPTFLPVGSQINQTSMARLLTLNSVDDFCLFGPPEPGPESLIGNVEPIVVAYCTKPRNNARLIPDGTITAAHFIRTPSYVQIYGFWDGTRVNIPAGDSGGELDPHGAENVGNPIGGNVTSNVSGRDVFYEEWMSFISYDQYCMRICTAVPPNSTTELMCEHELDIMGCQFVMAIPDFYSSNNSFTSCEGNDAVPPGLYPGAGGSISTFRQRYTGSYTQNGSLGMFTVGQTITPSAPALYPATSNCITYSTISNGVNTANFAVTAAPVVIQGSSTVTGSVGSTSMSMASISGASSRSGSMSGSSMSASASASSSRSGSASAASGNAASSVSSGAAAATSSRSAGTKASTGLDVTVMAMLVGVVGMVGGAAAIF